MATLALYGHVGVSRASSWPVIAATVFLTVIAIGILLATLAVPAGVNANGHLRSSEGVARMSAPQSGTIASIKVREGQQVTRKQDLVEISYLRTTRDGAAVEATLQEALDLQEAALNRRLVANAANQRAERTAATRRAMALTSEIGGLRESLRAQRRLVNLAEEDLARATAVSTRSFITRAQLAQREERLLSRQQEMANIEGKIASMSQEVQALRADGQIAEGKILEAANNIAGTLAELKIRRADEAFRSGYMVKTPKDGRVKLGAIANGDNVSVNQELLAIVPLLPVSVIDVELDDRSITHVRIGDTVRVEVGAFPASSYGYFSAQITNISAIATESISDARPTRMIFQARARLLPEKGGRIAIDRLVDGMVVTIYIRTRNAGFLDRIASQFGAFVT
jgi:multidrug resistance efflux pump